MYARSGRTQTQQEQWLRALNAIIPSLLTLTCGVSSHAILVVNAPATVTARVPFTVTVTAMYNGMPDTIIDGPIHFTSSDPSAILPTLAVAALTFQKTLCHRFTRIFTDLHLEGKAGREHAVVKARTGEDD